MSHLSVSRLSRLLLIVLALRHPPAAQNIQYPQNKPDMTLRSDLRVDLRPA